MTVEIEPREPDLRATCFGLIWGFARVESGLLMFGVVTGLLRLACKYSELGVISLGLRNQKPLPCRCWYNLGAIIWNIMWVDLDCAMTNKEKCGNTNVEDVNGQEI